MIVARQSTARTVTVGPVLDADGVAVTDCVIGDFKISKNGGAPAALNGSATLTHRHTGHYSLAATASDLDTVGQAEVVIDDTVNACPMKVLTVVEEAVYDALFAASAPGYVANAPVNVAQFGGSNGAFASGRPEVNLSHIAGSAVSTTTAQLGVNAVQISGDGTAADNLETAFDDTAGAVPWMGIADQGTAQSATSTTVVLRSAAAFANDTLIGMTIGVFGSTQGYWQFRTITDNTLSDDTVTVEAWTVTPSGTITYKIFGTAPSTGGGGLDAAGVRAAIGMASANLDTQLSGLDTKLDTIDNFLDTEVAAILADTNELQTDWANGGRLDNILDARASQSSVDTVDGIVDAILVDTAEIGAAGAGLTEAGGTGDQLTAVPWNAAWDAEVQSEATDALNAYDPPTRAEATSDKDEVLAVVATVDGVADAIKAKTDQLTFDAGGGVDSNITHVIGNAVQENGATDTNWGGAP